MIIKKPIVEDLLLQAIYEHIEEEAAKEPRRPYIGASSIGDDCELKLWMYYKYPHLARKTKAELKLAAMDGHRCEDFMAANFRKIPGIEVITHDENGKQFGFSDLGGAYKGHWDGLITGIPQAPKTTHTWEHKAKNEAFYEKLLKIKEKFDEKEVLKEWDYLYYCQAVTYMHYSDTTRHYMTVSTSGLRKIQSIRTDCNPKLAILLREKAERISRYPSPPTGISTNPSFWRCKDFCDFKDNCPSINKNKKL